ncbi:MAG TPA: T9SS type A sorting domain-containing protein [Bacteroidetes bacterium]|nr:T9SS type A sorting domain-containing protein [Bacteroidota bacterium]
MKKKTILVISLLTLLAVPALSVICTWTGPMGGTWSTTSNWDCGHVPVASDGVVIPDGSEVTLDITTTVADLTIEGGTISGGLSETLTVAGMLLWEKGVLDVVIVSGGSMEMKTLAIKTIKKLLAIDGSCVWDAGEIYIDEGGEMEVNGSFTVVFAGIIHFSTSMPGLITNKGMFINNHTGTLTIDVDFSNTATGTVKGTGTLKFSSTGSFTNAGTVAPGLSPGLLTIDPDYTNGALLDMEILDGSGAGTGHDKLTVSGSATLTGELKVTETGSVPNGTYTVLECLGGASCITGTFTTTTLPSGYTVAYTGTTVTVTKSALPVELVGFSAQLQGENVLLKWETASETNNDYFSIERSTDARHFETIGTISGHGTSLISHEYNFLDKNIFEYINNESVYYRLRQNDFNGMYVYSDMEIVFLENNSRSFFIENIYQEKNGRIHILINSLYQLISPEITLHNMFGQVVFEKNIFIKKNKTETILPVTGLPPGVYILNIKSERGALSEKFYLR